MDRITTWDLLRLALMGLALGFSVLLWYIKHFIDTLRDAENESINMRHTIARSPRIFAILCGVVGIFTATSLSTSVIYDAFEKGIMAIPLWSAGFWLLIMGLAAPLIGAISIGVVAIGQIGWLGGLKEAWNSLWPKRNAYPVALVNVNDVLPITLNGRTVKEIFVDDSIIATWKTSEMWVRTNERGWKLGKGFLDSNRFVLLSIVDQCWKQQPEKIKESDVQILEHCIEKYIYNALARLNIVEAQILNRPLQLARAACSLYTEGQAD